MKLTVSMFLILMFVLAGVFVFTGMEAHAGNDHCPAALIKGTSCAFLTGVLGVASFHLSAFKIVTTAIFLILFLLVVVLLNSNVGDYSLVFSRLTPAAGFFKPVSSNWFLSWLSLKENSPNQR